MLITSPAGTATVRPLLGNLRELATSGVVAGNVKSTLRLPESAESLRRHLDASVRPGSEVIAITATGRERRQGAATGAGGGGCLRAASRGAFRHSTPELHAAGLDSAHVLAGPDRHFLRNVLIGALVGLLLGSVLMFVLRERHRQVAASVADDLSKREDLVEQRVNGVTARERAIADRAGKLAAREQELDERAAALAAAEREVGSRARELASSERKLADRAAEIAMSKRELEVLAAAPPPPAPEPVSVPQVETEPALPPRTGTWNLTELQAAVDAYADPTPEQAENWRTYLYFVREHASPDGTLPRSLDPLIADVFAEIVHRRAPS